VFPIVTSRYDHVNIFFNQLSPLVVNEYVRRKGQKRLFPSTVLAMAALESGYNLNAKTLFGIKGDGVVLDTTEYIDGEYVNVKDSFKSYPSLAASVQGLYDLMQWDNYDRATSCTDYEEECRMVQSCGYATDPEYSDKLINIVNTYQLTMFNYIDEPVEETEEPEEASEEPFIYTVQAGDTLWGIVRNYYNFDNDIDIYDKVQEVVINNNIEDANMIYTNQEIKLY
jgi:LysM repeat protein